MPDNASPHFFLKRLLSKSTSATFFVEKDQFFNEPLDSLLYFSYINLSFQLDNSFVAALKRSNRKSSFDIFFKEEECPKKY